MDSATPASPHIPIQHYIPHDTHTTALHANNTQMQQHYISIKAGSDTCQKALPETPAQKRGKIYDHPRDQIPEV